MGKHKTSSQNLAVVTGEFLGQLERSHGPLTIDGMWGLRFLAGSLNVVAGAVYFTAGPDHEADGLLGDIVTNS
ncbi:MAG TPA: hypothetical protein VFZ97_08535 [Acidimicrobiales bacterium]